MPRHPDYLSRRIVRPHPFDRAGLQILAPTLDALTRAERRRAPETLGDLLLGWNDRLRRAPRALSWIHEKLEGLVPILERSRLGGREFWRIRLTHPFRDSLAGAAFGCDGIPLASGTKTPEEIRWLRKTFGTCDVGVEQSGSCQWRTLDWIARRERADVRRWAKVARAPMAEDRWMALREALPARSRGWISLYEADGDWVFADVERDVTVWVGGEWTGIPALELAVPWRRATSFVLWRVMDAGRVLPVDLEMLGG